MKITHAKTKLISAGTRYNLYVSVSQEHQKVALSIKLKDGTFEKGTNTVGVILTKEKAQELIQQIQEGLA